MNLQNAHSELFKLWTGVDEYTAGAHPKLWGIQVHLATGFALIGLIVCGILAFLFTILAAETKLGLLSLAVIGQLGLLALWIARLVTVPRPLNLVEFRNSPQFTFLMVFSVMVMSGPTLLLYYCRDLLPKEVVDLLPVFVGEAFLFAIMFRFIATLKAPLGRSRSVPFAAAMFFCFILCAVLIWLDLRPLSVTILIAVAVGMGVCHVLLSIRAGWRSRLDAFWLDVATLVPPACVAIVLLQIRTPSPALIVRSIVESDSSVTYFLACASLSVWVDVTSWVQARFSMLPASEN